jgi:hypothetical protein
MISVMGKWGFYSYLFTSIKISVDEAGKELLELFQVV